MAPNIWNGQTRKIQPVVEVVQINLIKLSNGQMRENGPTNESDWTR